jgi:hypothetical protein
MTQVEIEAMICDPEGIDRDEKGNPMYLGLVRGVRVCAVVALDEPDLIVTIFRKERW